MTLANTSKAITVKELIEALQKAPESMQVFYPDWWIFSESSQDESDYMNGLSNVEIKNGQVHLS